MLLTSEEIEKIYQELQGIIHTDYHQSSLSLIEAGAKAYREKLLGMGWKAPVISEKEFDKYCNEHPTCPNERGKEFDSDKCLLCASEAQRDADHVFYTAQQEKLVTDEELINKLIPLLCNCPHCIKKPDCLKDDGKEPCDTLRLIDEILAIVNLALKQEIKEAVEKARQKIRVEFEDLLDSQGLGENNFKVSNWQVFQEALND